MPAVRNASCLWGLLGQLSCVLKAVRQAISPRLSINQERYLG